MTQWKKPGHVFKLRSERKGDHVHEYVFAGPDEEHLAFVGNLVFRIGEWQSFGAALLLGQANMRGSIKIITEGSEQVVGMEEA